MVGILQARPPKRTNVLPQPRILYRERDMACLASTGTGSQMVKPSQTIKEAAEDEEDEKSRNMFEAL